MRLVADENIPGLDCLGPAGIEILSLPGRAIRAEDLEHAQALLVRSVTRVDAQLLSRATQLRFVGTATSGFDHVDRKLLRDREIGFAHAPGSNANSVVEYVLSAMAEADGVLERLLAGGRVGIVGFGEIGQRLGRRLDALGIAWMVSDPWKERRADIPQAATLAQVLAADVVTLHCELTDASPFPSHHLLDGDKLAQLTERQLLINASRGAVVDNTALRQRLQGTGAPRVVLDVWEGEPAPDMQLLDLVWRGTAHIAGYSWDGKLLATHMLLSRMAAALSIASLEMPGTSGEELSVSLTSADSTASAIRTLVAARYRLAEDDRLFRSALLASGNDDVRRGRAFDALRRNYRQRRELRGSALPAVQVPGALREAIEGLGVEIVASQG